MADPQCLSRKHFLLESTDFQDFPGPPTIFKDFPVLENARLKFKYFQFIILWSIRVYRYRPKKTPIDLFCTVTWKKYEQNGIYFPLRNQVHWTYLLSVI